MDIYRLNKRLINLITNSFKGEEIAIEHMCFNHGKYIEFRFKRNLKSVWLRFEYKNVDDDINKCQITIFDERAVAGVGYFNASTDDGLCLLEDINEIEDVYLYSMKKFGG